MKSVILFQYMALKSVEDSNAILCMLLYFKAQDFPTSLVASAALALLILSGIWGQCYFFCISFYISFLAFM